MPTHTAPRSAGQRRKAKKRRSRLPIVLLVFAICLGSFALATRLIPSVRVAFLERIHMPSWVDVQIVDVNGTGRRGEPLHGINDIVIHYVGNPGTTAQQNHDFFDQPDTQVSAHFLVGLDGEVIQCIPLGEISSASNDRNGDTISIEVCHPDETGRFNDATYQSLVRLTAWLCDDCKLDRGDVIRHYDVTGKLCPLYFVEHEDAWQQFKADVASYSE